MKMFGVKVEGYEENIKALRRLMKVVPKAAQRGATKGSLKILADARKQAPIDTGHLRASGYVTWGTGGTKPGRVRRDTKYPRRGAPQTPWIDNTDAKEAYAESANIALTRRRSSSFVVVVGFGAWYAIFVHEGDPGWDWNDGGPKFLEKSLRANLDHFVNCVEREVVREIIRRF